MSKYILGHRAQTRADAIRYILSIGILILLASVLQVSFVSRFRIFGTVPDLMLCILLCISFFCGKQAGAITGIICGFLIEAMGSYGIMLLPLVYMLFGYFTGHYARAALPRSFSAYLPYLGIAVVLRAAVTVLYTVFYHNVSSPVRLLANTVFPEMLLTAAVGCILYFPIYRFCRFLENKRR